ncbi:hypothetical protein [Fischerella thermalis]|uniref:hypothetical protein n=1 Tax=Fischerella thermalis TaxID=372787 RepID=UPI001F3F9038|nr:hypothetical protein [Fischerella thermalis]
MIHDDRKPNAAAVSSKLGYRSSPPNFRRGWAIAYSNKPISRIPPAHQIVQESCDVALVPQLALNSESCQMPI